MPLRAFYRVSEVRDNEGMKWPLRFRLRFKKRSRYYIDLVVFETKAKMHKKNKLEPECEAFFWGETKSYRVGVVHCYLGSANPASLAHEFVHAGLEYLAVLKKTDLRPKSNDSLPYEERPEEILCFAVQELLDQALVKIQDALR